MNKLQQCDIVNSLLCRSYQRKSDKKEWMTLGKGRPTLNLSWIQIEKYTNRASEFLGMRNM